MQYSFNNSRKIPKLAQFIPGIYNNFYYKILGYFWGVTETDRSQRILGLSQETYINKVVERFHLKDCSPSIAPIIKGDKFNMNQCPSSDLEKKGMKNIPYASIVWELNVC